MGQTRLRFLALALWVSLQGAAAEALRGTVLEDHTGRPLLLAGLRIRPAERSAVPASQLTTDLNGRFQSGDLPPGAYDIEVYRQDYLETRLRISVPAQPLAVRLVKLGTIWGRVLDLDGRPNRAARVAVMVKPAQGLVLQPFGSPIQVDRNGQFRAAGLPPGEYAVAVLNAPLAGPGGAGRYYYPRNARPQFFTFSGGEVYRDIEFRLPQLTPHRISGRVALPETDGRFVLSLYLAGQPLLPVATAWASAGGAFTMADVPPGEYELIAFRPSYGYGAQGGLLSPDDVLANLRLTVAEDMRDVQLTPAGRRDVSLALRSPSPAAPPAGCPVSVRVTMSQLLAPGAGRRYQVDLGPGEPVALDGVSPGRYRIVADLGQTCFLVSPSVLEIPWDAEALPLSIEVASAGSVHGRVHPPQRTTGNWVVVLLSSPADGDTASLRIAEAGENGEYFFTGLRPGWYRIALRPGAGGISGRWLPDLLRMREIQVASGPSLQFDLSSPELSYK